MKKNYALTDLNRFCFLSIFLFLFSFNGFGQTVTIGSGTNIGNKLPVVPIYEYSFTEQIIPQSEINIAGTITRIRLYSNGYNIDVSNNWTIYLGHTNKTTFTNDTDWILSGAMTQVFSGTVPASPATGWMEIILSTPFIYNNSDNLVVAIDENAAGYNGSGNAFRIFTPSAPSPTTNSGIYYQSDSTNPDPASITLTGTRTNYRSQIQLEFTSLVPCSGTPTGGTVTVNPTSGNPGSTYGVTASGYTIGTGLTYQWQYNDGSGWNNQGTATASYTALTGMVAPA